MSQMIFFIEIISNTFHQIEKFVTIKTIRSFIIKFSILLSFLYLAIFFSFHKLNEVNCIFEDELKLIFE